MNCFKCKKELLFEDSLLKDFVACPYCGAFFPKILEPIENGSIEAELKKLADEFGGLEIFSEENASRFAKSLAKLNSPFDVARDKLLVANIKKIPQRLYSVIEQTQNEKQQMADLCFDEMISFGLPQEFAKETIAWLTQVMRFSVNLERKPLIEKNYGTFTDPRDDQTYKTVKIGNQVWMAENLKYKIRGSCCYDGHFANCEKYGRLYTWDAAFDACLPGWHLPTKEEFETLLVNVGGIEFAGKMLKSKQGWDEDGNGIDKYGFNVLPAGYRGNVDYIDSGYSFDDAGMNAYFWSYTEDDEDYAYFLTLDCYSESARLEDYTDKEKAFSVRCIRD